MRYYSLPAIVVLGLSLGAGCTPSAGEGSPGGSSGGRSGSGPGSGGRAAGSGGRAGEGGAVPGTGGGSGQSSGGSGALGGTGGASGSGAGGGSSGAASSGGGGAGGAIDAPVLPPGAMPPDKLPPCGRMVPVADAAALTAALAGAMAGDCVVLADGSYPGFTVTTRATVDAPLVIRAANRGKAVMIANATMTGAAHVVLEGLSFTGMASAIANGDSQHCRITRNRFQLGVARATGTAKYTRIDRNEFGPKNTGDGHYIHATESSEFSQIDRNYLHDATGGGTSRDAVSLGCCGPMFDYHDTGNVFEYNLMVNCSSDAEYISIKSSSNTVRYNTFRRNGGTLTLRAGRKNNIHGNYFFGGGGIRAYEDDHKIWNNYIETGTALNANGDGGGHAPLRRAIIVHNTFLGSVSIGGTGHTIANNIGGGGGMANLSAAAAGLTRKGEVLSIGAGSGAIDKAVGSFPFVTDDLHGQPRDKPDIGADEWSTSPEMSLRRPLTPADVGVEAP